MDRIATSPVIDSPRQPQAPARAPGRTRIAAGGPGLRILPCALVAAVLLAVWLLSDVSLGHALTFVGYELGFVVVPGWLVYSALTRRVDFGLRHVAVAWAFGYALELGAFIATASAGMRGAYSFYPLVVVALTAPFVLPRLRALRDRARESGSRPRFAPRWAWALAGLITFALVDIGVALFPVWRLPWKLGSGLFYYPHDWLLGNNVAAESAQHWPVTAPNVVGTSLHYHYFAFLHMGAIRQVTHLDLTLINFRLVTIPMVILATLLAFVLGRKLSNGNPWVGVGAAFLALYVDHLSVIAVLVCAIGLALVLLGRRTSPQVALAAGAAVVLAGALSFDTWKTHLSHPQNAIHTLWSNTFDTPTFALGLVLFLAVAVELSDRLAEPRRGYARASDPGWSSPR